MSTIGIDALSGLLAGGSSTILLHPLDVAKTRMQISGSGSTIAVIRHTCNTAGLARGVYRGLGTNLIGGAVGWAVYFAWYGETKRLALYLRSAYASTQHDGAGGADGAYDTGGRGREVGGGQEQARLSATEYLLSAALAGALTAACTNPVWVVKTRLLNTDRADPAAYRSFTHGLRRILRDEGFAGLWRGLVPSLLGVAHGSLQFALYEKLKDNRRRSLTAASASASASASGSTTAGSAAAQLGTWDYLELSASSKLAATLLTYPYQVLRSRMQWHSGARRSMAATFADVYRKDGAAGFYRGLTPNLARVVPATCVTLCVYEATRAAFTAP